MRFYRIFLNQYFLLGLIVVLGFTLRMYKADSPIADWHSWRQADTAAVARQFYKAGYNPFVPRYDDMSGVAEKPYPNPDRYRFVEFPIYNSLVYFAYLLNGGVDEKLARVISAAISLGSIIFIYLITRRYFGVSTAHLASLIFAILPYSVFFSRVVLPEPTLVFLSLGMFYFVDRWIFENTRALFLGAFAFTMLSFLTKPYCVFYLLPAVYLYRHKEGKWWPVPARYFNLFLPALIPFVLWRGWMSIHPEGIPASKWLLNGDGIRFKPVFWRWILDDRFSREIMGVTGTVLYFVGLLRGVLPRESMTLHLFAFSSLSFLVVFATGNVTHDYYQYFIVPSLSIFMARGFMILVSGVRGFLPRVVTAGVACLFLFMSIYSTWEVIRGFYQINDPAIVEAGKAVDQLTPKDAVVIAPYGGSTSFLYYTNRNGWPVVAFPTIDLINRYGATHYVSTAKDAKTKWLMKKYAVMVDDPSYVIIDLTKPNPIFSPLEGGEPN